MNPSRQRSLPFGLILKKKSRDGGEVTVLAPVRLCDDSVNKRDITWEAAVSEARRCERAARNKRADSRAAGQLSAGPPRDERGEGGLKEAEKKEKSCGSPGCSLKNTAREIV